MSGKKSPYPDGRIPDRLPDGRPAVPWKSRWTEGVLPLAGSNSWWNGCTFRRRPIFLRLVHWCGLSINSIFIVTSQVGK